MLAVTLPRLSVLIAVLMLCACSSAGAPPGDIEALTTALDREIPERLRLTGTPGAALALVRGGRVVWANAYGLADVESARPVQPDSVFGVASISKSVTAWGVMKLVEAGKIELDAPVGRYVSRWQLPASEFDPDEVTIRRLLSHSAGLNTPEYLGRLPDAPAAEIETILTEGDGRTPGLRLVRQPGSGFAYSDGGYLLLQLVIEEVSGEPFETYMQREVLDPLGIEDAGFAPRPELLAALVTSYDIEGNPLPKYEYVEKAPAGLYITAPGLAKFAAAAMRGLDGAPQGGGVLTPESVAEMLTMHVELEGFERLIYADGYGLGYYTESTGDGALIVSHMGANLNGVTEFAALPERGEAIVVLTTGMAGQEVFADALQQWIRWLGYDAITLPRAIRTARSGMYFLAGLLNGLALLITLRIVRGFRRGTLPPLRKADIALALTPIASGAFYLFAYRYLKIAMPSAAPWILAELVWLSLLGPLWVALRWRVPGDATRKMEVRQPG